MDEGSAGTLLKLVDAVPTGAQVKDVLTWIGLLPSEDDDLSIAVAGTPPTNVDVELKHAAAIYGVAGVPLGENGRIFARVGYGTQKIEASAAGVAIDGSEESVNYGVGAQYFFDGQNGIRGDYTKHDFNDSGDADVWSVSYVRRFR